MISRKEQINTKEREQVGKVVWEDIRITPKPILFGFGKDLVAETPNIGVLSPHPTFISKSYWPNVLMQL